MVAAGVMAVEDGAAGVMAVVMAVEDGAAGVMAVVMAAAGAAAVGAVEDGAATGATAVMEAMAATEAPGGAGVGGMDSGHGCVEDFGNIARPSSSGTKAVVFTKGGTVRNSVRGQVDHHTTTNLSSNMMANWVFASHHSRGGIFHSPAT